MKLLKNKFLRQLFTLLIIAGVGYFFVTTLQRNWQAVEQVHLQLSWMTVGAIALFALAVIVSGYLWGVMLNILTAHEGRRVSMTEAARVHVASWLLKYIPGQAGSLVNKITWAKQNDYGKKLVLVTFVYENIFLLSISLLPTLPILLLSVGGGVFVQHATYLLLPLLIAVPMVIVSHKKTMHAISNLLFTKFLKQSADEQHFLSTSAALKLQLLFAIPRIINGAGFVLVVASFFPVAASAYLPLACAYVVAGAVGIMAIFVPSGIGVREAVIVILAASVMPVEQAIIASLIARLYSTVADGLLAAGYGLMKLRKRKTV